MQPIHAEGGKRATMRINENDIIEEIDAHIRRCGGEFGQWSVGTAKDSEGASLRCHREQHPEERLIYREAYTPYAAAEAMERLVEGYGLRADPGSASGSVVYVYRASGAGAERSSGKRWDKPPAGAER